MESVIYILVVTGALATIFFAIAFREANDQIEHEDTVAVF